MSVEAVDLVVIAAIAFALFFLRGAIKFAVLAVLVIAAILLLTGVI